MMTAWTNLSYKGVVRIDSGSSRSQDLKVPAMTLMSIHLSSSMSISSPAFKAACRAFTLATDPGTRYNPISFKPIVNRRQKESYLDFRVLPEVCLQPKESL